MQKKISMTTMTILQIPLQNQNSPFNGRNRRYYQITSAGRAQLAAYAQEWSHYRSSIDTFFREVE